MFPELIKVHDALKIKVGYDDQWQELMLWTLFQEFHAEARALVSRGATTLDTRTIDQSRIEMRYHRNLSVKEWNFLLNDYERS